jgi:pilus assembly protein Flp/PilA
MRGRSFFDFLADESAVTSIEYALVASMIFLVIVVAVRSLGSNVSSNLWSNVANNLPSNPP